MSNMIMMKCASLRGAILAGVAAMSLSFAVTAMADTCKGKAVESCDVKATTCVVKDKAECSVRKRWKKSKAGAACKVKSAECAEKKAACAEKKAACAEKKAD